MKKWLSFILVLALLLSLTCLTGTAADLLADKSAWTVSVNSTFASAYISRGFDGNPSTYWHSKYTAEGSTITSHDNPPYYIRVVFPSNQTVSGLVYTPRQDGNTGRWKAFEVYASSNDTDAGVLVLSASPENSAEVQTFNFTKVVSAKKLIIKVTDTVGGYGTLGEMDFIKGSGTGDSVLSGKAEDQAVTSGTSDAASTASGNAASAASSEEEKSFDTSAYTFATGKEAWKISANSEMPSWGVIKNAFDGIEKTYWHTEYKVNDEGKAVAVVGLPYEITVTFPLQKSLTGMYYLPRQDNGSGRFSEIEVYASKAEGERGELLAEASLKTDSIAQIVYFGKRVEAKTITIVVQKTNGAHATCAEIEFIESDLEDPSASLVYREDGSFDTENWKIKCNSSVNWAPIQKAFDGDPKTYWHSDYTNEGTKVLSHDMPPYDIDIVLPQAAVITGFTLLPRQDGKQGLIQAYELYAAENDTDELQLLLEEELDPTTGLKTVDFGCGILAKHLFFRVTDGQGGYGTCAELTFLPGTDETNVVSFDAMSKEREENVLRRVDPSSVTMENDDPIWAGSMAMLSDGDGSSFWQTEVVNGTVSIIADLGEVLTVSALSITPRPSGDFHGYWERFTIWSSEDGQNWEEVLTDYRFPGEKNLNEKFIYFDGGHTARYYEFEINEYYSRRVSCAEISFWQTKAQRDADPGSGTFIMQIGSRDITVKKADGDYQKTIDVAPFVTAAGSTLIPLRGLLEEMGAEIEWDDRTQTITVTKDKLVITLQIKNPLVYVDGTNYGLVRYTLNSAPRIRDSRTFVPVRFLSEQLGYQVAWDGETKTITISK